MAITDLTGTTWQFNDTPSADSSAIYNINYEYIPIANTGLAGNYTSFQIERIDDTTLVIVRTPSVWFYNGGWQDSGAGTIAITGGSDSTNTKLIAWLEANATLISGGESEEISTVEITYNGTTFATIEGGQTATLSCSGKKLKSDISVSFGTAGTITYNGKETAVQAGQTATFLCGGKKAVTDIVIKAIETVSYTDFIIEEKTYRAESGMTWSEWIASDYNARADGNKFYESDNLVYIDIDGTTYKVLKTGEDGSSVEVISTEEIIGYENGTTYVLEEMVMITGVWQFPETIDVYTFPNEKVMVNFKSGANNNTDFNCMFVEDGMLYYGDYEMAYFQSWYTNEHMRVDFGDTEQAVPKSFYDWLIANATQGSDMATLITFTIYGVEYQAEDGMTWRQWCDSSYNTDGYYVNWANGWIYNSSGSKIIYGENFMGVIGSYDYTLGGPTGGFPDPF